MVKRSQTQMQYVVIFYNVLEAFFAIFFGVLSQSIALISFGLISVIETISNFIMVRRLRKVLQKKSAPIGMTLNKPMISMAIISFFGGSWVLIQSLKVLILNTPPLRSMAAIIVAFGSLVLMPALTFWFYHNDDSPKSKMKTGFYDIRFYMLISVSLIFCLCLNYFFGYWKADPIFSLFISAFLYKKSFDCVISKGEGDGM